MYAVSLKSGLWRKVLSWKLKLQNEQELETKASSHEGQCIPAGSSVSLPRMMLITIYVNNNHA